LADEIKNLSISQKPAYFNNIGNSFFIKDSLKNKISFHEQNMLTDVFEKDFDLIVCRNVVIYFTNETKDMLFRKFYAALRKGGILFVGGTEIIPRPQEIGFASAGISLYKKV
jgi:chemotaxis protein methyltransferase CheR